MLNIHKNISNFYIHIPFCIKKCYFCAFPIHAIGQTTTQDKKNILYTQYCQNLQKQINLLSKNGTSFNKNIQSIYFGGGTPSLLTLQHINTILNNFKNGITNNTQISLQMNPQEIGKGRKFLQIGINRLSVGIQTLNNQTLSKLNRNYQNNYPTHQSNFKQELRQLSKNANINLDFIIDLNNHSDQQQMIQFISYVRPTHISLYALQVNQGSYLYRHQNQFKRYIGNFQDYQKLSRILSEKFGYDHYQVSNFCLPGYSSLHNRSYWEGDKQFGAFGMGATSLINSMRITRPKNLSKYYKYIERLEKRQQQQQIVQNFQINNEKSNEQKLKWMILSRLRKKQGIKWQQIQKYLQQSNQLEIENKINKIKNTIKQINSQKKYILDIQWLNQGVRLIVPLGYLYTDYIGYKIIDSLNL